MKPQRSVVILHGDDSFALKAAEDALIQELVDPGFMAMNLTRLEGASTSPSVAAAAAATMPFGPGARLVLVEDCPYFTSKLDEDETEAFEEFLRAGLPPSCYLVLSVPKAIDRRLKATKAAEAHAELRAFALPNARQEGPLVDWIMQRARAEGIKLGTDLAEELVHAQGTDRWKLASELDKLATYAAGAPITREALSALMPPGQHDVFEILAALMARKPAGAIARMHAVVVTEPALKVVATMATMLRKWLQYRLLQERGMNADQIAAKTGGKSFAIRRDFDTFRGWSSTQLQGALERVLAADSALKRGGGKEFERLQLERLLVSITHLR